MQLWSYLEKVAAAVTSAVLLWLLGQLLKPVKAWVIAMGWQDFSNWFANLGWFLFVMTVAVWLVSRWQSAAVQVGGRSGGAVGRQPEPKPQGLVIHSASYGLPGQDLDVTDVLTRLIRKGKLDVLVRNHIMGDDPAVGLHKRLIVTYSGKDGVRMFKEVSEKDRLILP